MGFGWSFWKPFVVLGLDVAFELASLHDPLSDAPIRFHHGEIHGGIGALSRLPEHIANFPEKFGVQIIGPVSGAVFSKKENFRGLRLR